MIAIIAAVAKNRVIGISGKLPWHLPADFLYFKETTIGYPIIMGKKTFDSIGVPLPNRQNIVLSKNFENISGIDVAKSISKAIELAHKNNSEIFIIGGASIYEQFIELSGKLYITEVDCQPEGDTYFPVIDMNIWKEVSRKHRKSDENNSHNMDFVVYERKE